MLNSWNVSSFLINSALQTFSQKEWKKKKNVGKEMLDVIRYIITVAKKGEKYDTNYGS